MAEWPFAVGVGGTDPVADFFVPRLDGLGDQCPLFVRALEHDIVIVECLWEEPVGACTKASFGPNVPDQFTAVARLSRTGGADIAVLEGWPEVGCTSRCFRGTRGCVFVTFFRRTHCVVQRFLLTRRSAFEFWCDFVCHTHQGLRSPTGDARVVTTFPLTASLVRDGFDERLTVRRRCRAAVADFGATERRLEPGLGL